MIGGKFWKSCSRTSMIASLRSLIVAYSNGVCFSAYASPSAESRC